MCVYVCVWGGGGGGGGMRDKMVISAYIFQKSRKGPTFKASNETREVMRFSRFYLKYTCTES